MHEPVLFSVGGGVASREPDRSIRSERGGQAMSLLRLVISGSVDDGKSSLLGRLLYDSERLFEDELAALAKDSRRYGTRGGEIDFALLVDGLVAEREQGITIDVAYRYFATRKRSFIVADTPGHEQYTRNMATGASTADVAVILVDARKGPLPQTRRHLFIVRMLGIRRVAIAVNKMDLIDFNRERFDQVAAECRDMAASLGLLSLEIIPVSATQGDNVVDGSRHMAWYRGPTLLRYLETITVEDEHAVAPFRFAVQWVSRPHADFRGYAGMIASGSVRPGSKVFCYPSGRATAVGQVLVGSDPVLEARAGQSVLLTLTDEIDVARGDVLVAEPSAITPVRQARVDLFWMADQPLQKGQSFLAKLGTSTAPATVIAIDHAIDVLDYRRTAAASIDANGLGAVTIAFDRPIPLVPYGECRELGGLILIDRSSNDTVALGLIVADAEAVPAGAVVERSKQAPSFWRALRSRTAALQRTPERPRRGLAKAITWRMTGSADTFILSFLFTGSAKISAAISGTEIFTKLLLYYGHERIWARIKFGLRGSGAARASPSESPAPAVPSDDDPHRQDQN
jgi:sulfate adenylyltransferase large subunit